MKDVFVDGIKQGFRDSISLFLGILVSIFSIMIAFMNHDMPSQDKNSNTQRSEI